jgi:glutamine amidotransferase-like uncharacterized protein
MKKIKQLQKDLSDWCTKKGIPVITFRDPVTQQPSASFTLLVISAGLVIFGLVNKIAKLVDGVDIENALQFFGICAGLYFGRKLTSNKKEEES